MARVQHAQAAGGDAVVLNPGVARPLRGRWTSSLTRLTAFDTSVDVVDLGPHVFDSTSSRSMFQPAALVVAVASGRIQGAAGSTAFEALPGQALLVDTRQPLVSRVDEDVRLLRVVVDQRRLRVGVPSGGPITTAVLTDSPVVTTCLGAVSTLLHRSQRTTAEDDDAAIAQLLTGLQFALLDESVRQRTAAGEPAVTRSQRESIERYITAHLGDPALGPATVAAALGISLRTVHAAFADSADSVARTIRSRRVDRVLAALEGLPDHREVEQLAVRTGFRDVPQMARVFRAVTGDTLRSRLGRSRA